MARDVSEFQGVVDAFASAMLERLEANAFKGGWGNERTKFMLDRMESTWRVLKCMEENGDMTYAKRLIVLKECADLANYCLMLSDMMGALDE